MTTITNYLFILVSCSFFLLRVRSQNICYAPPLTYGDACFSSTPLISSLSCETIIYTINVLESTTVECYGLGASPCSCSNQECTCKWQYYYLGVINNVSSSLVWGANGATPSIYCQGLVTGSSLTWNWKSSIINNQCNYVGLVYYCPPWNC